MFRGILRPGQGFRAYSILRRQNGVTSSGRPTTGALEEVGIIHGMISQASQKEAEQWKQNGHPISHKIVQRGAVTVAKVTDILELKSPVGTSRRFMVQGVHNPAELGHFVSYQVLERGDL